MSAAVFENTIPGISSGDVYKVKIRGRNRIGYSAFSTETLIYAATVPDAPNQPTRVAETNTKTTINL